MNKRYPVIILSTDAALLRHEGDVADRMRAYASLYSEIHIVVSAPMTEETPLILGEGVSVYPVGKGSKVATLVRMYAKTKTLMHERGIRYVMAQDPFLLGFIAWFLTRRGRGIFSVGLYGTDPENSFFRCESMKHRFYALLARFVMPRATAIQSDGPETISRLRSRFGERIFFKPMFPSNLEQLGGTERHEPTSPFRVLFMGRFVPQKNIPLLVDVIAETYTRARGSIEFTLVGNGPEHAWFIREVERRDLASVCHVRGVIPREEIETALQNSDALCMVSRYEGFPRVFMESAVSGLPIVTTDVGGVEGLVVDGESGFVLPQGSTAEDIASKILELARDKSLWNRFSKGIKARWDGRYGGKTVLDYQRPLADFVATKL